MKIKNIVYKLTFHVDFLFLEFMLE